MCLFLGTFLIIYTSNASASSVVDQSDTEVGIHILKGDYPPEPAPPSPIIHKNAITPTGRLPQTGASDCGCWGVIGSLLLILILYVNYYRWLQDKKRGMFSEKL